MVYLQWELTIEVIDEMINARCNDLVAARVAMWLSSPLTCRMNRKIWRALQDSNLWPSAPEADALSS